MATTVLNNVTVLVNGTNISGLCNEATVNYAAEMIDQTTFGATTRERRGGLTTITIGLKGFLIDAGTTGPETVLGDVIGTCGTQYAFFPTTVNACYECGFAGRGVVQDYNPGGAVGAIAPFTATIASAGVEG